MCEDNWTGREEERQDCVDNAIYNLLLDLGKTDEDALEWDIEDIANIREAVQDVLVEKHKLMDEQEFYPYRELKPETEVKNWSDLPVEKEIIVTDKQLSTAVCDVIVNDLDADDLAYMAGDFLGGTCFYKEDGKYSFVPNEYYSGAFDYLTKGENKDG